MEYLNLSDNTLSGEIWIIFSNLRALKELNLEYNQFSGTLPFYIEDVSDLEVLNLSYNSLSGAIPPEIGELVNLRDFILRENQFAGNLPVEIGNMINLSFLCLDNNQFTGDIPVEIGLLESLRIVYLYNNEFTYLPDFTGNLMLWYLDVFNNHFEFGDIERNLGGASYSYTPQKEVDTPEHITTEEGQSAQFTTTVSGSANHYQWYHEGVLLSGATDSILLFPSVSFADLGTYVCEITSDVVTNLTLTTYEKTLEVTDGSLNTDSLALVALYNATDGPNWDDNTNWLTGPVSSWYGITVEGGRVVNISLVENHLNGTLPAELGNLSALDSLDLSKNSSGYSGNLHGFIPSELGNLTNLTYLNLSYNSLIGIIPSELGSLTNLEYMQLSSNQLSGSIPIELGNLTYLEYLSLSDNQLIGSIPSELGILANLNNMYLSGNQLSGSIPSELGILANLNNMYLSGNQLSGSIPSELGNLTNLEYMQLTDNQLSGSIPVELGNLTNLFDLTLSYNQLGGSIPVELGNLTNLEALDLRFNSLNGSIPSELGNLTNLEWLFLGSNSLNGSIPSELGNLTNLTWLLLDGNSLSGSIPSELGNMNLVRLYLQDNELSGNIPPELGNLTSLVWLHLYNNSLSGSIPTELGNLTELRELYLNENLLSGNIPIELGNLTELRYLRLNENSLSGSIPIELGNLTELQHLFLSYNSLSGSIPSELGNLTNLSQFILRDNSFSGELPEQLNDIVSMRVLEVTNNDLTGIPIYTNWPSILFFYIYNNHIEFQDIEDFKNFGVDCAFTYAPQKGVDTPEHITTEEGQSAQFTTTVSGSANHYQWYHEGVLLSGATDSILLFPSVSFADSGTYVCEITSDVVTDLTLTTYEKTLEVTDAVQIIDQSDSVYCCLGDNEYLFVYSEDENLSYQWYKNGSILPGANSDTLYFNPVAYSDTANYSCELWNESDTSMSENMYLGILVVPMITVQPDSITSCLGNDEFFTLDALGDSLEYQWYKDASLMIGETHDTLHLLNVGMADEANYSVRVFNTCGLEQSANAYLDIQIVPSINAQSGSILTCLNDYEFFEVDASGDSLHFQWRKNGIDLPGETDDSLHFASVQYTDTADYDCMIRNFCDTIYSNTMNLSVDLLIAPDSVTTEQNYFCSGSIDSVQLTAHGGAGDTVFWYASSGAATPIGWGTVKKFKAPLTDTVYFAAWKNDCGFSFRDSVLIFVHPLPAQFNLTGGGAYCSGGTGVDVGLDNSESGVEYTLVLDGTPTTTIVAGTGTAISFGDQTTAGDYTVSAMNTSTTCEAEMTGTVSISIDPNPTAFTVTGGGSYCNGGTGVEIGLDGSEIGVDYTLYRDGVPTSTVVSGTGFSLSFGNQLVGFYTVEAENVSTHCTLEMGNIISVSIYPDPTDFTVIGGGSYCAGGTGVEIVLDGSEIGVEYTLVLDGTPTSTIVAGTGAAISFGDQSTAGDYTVSAENTTTSCTNDMAGTATIIINDLPTAFNVTGGGSYCAGGTGVEIGLDGSETGVEYTLVLDGTPTANIVAGTGVAISFGDQTTAGEYTVFSMNTSTTCEAEMSGTATISIDDLPTAYNITGGGVYCAGGTGVEIGLDGSETGVEYTLVLDGTPTANIVAGTGVAISFGDQTTAGDYTVSSMNTSTTCEAEMSGTATISIDDLPTAFNVTGGGSYCAGGTGVEIGLDGSEIGVEYTLVLDGTPTTTIVVGTGAAISFGDQTTAGDYTVSSMNTSTTCEAEMSGTATISIDDLPTAYNITGGGVYCAGGTGVEIGLDGSETGVEYTLVFDGTPTITIVAGTGAAISFGDQIDAGAYTVIAQNTSTLCEVEMSGTLSVDIVPLPVVSFTGLSESYCEGQTAVLLTGNFAPEGEFIGNGITDNGDGTAWFDPVIAGIGGPYDINYSYTAPTNCLGEEIQQVTVSPLPLVSFTGLSEGYCQSAADVLLTGSEAPAGSFSGDGITDHGNGTATLSFAGLAATTDYNITYSYEDANTCTGISVQAFHLYADPQADFEVTNGCPGESLYFTDSPTIFADQSQGSGVAIVSWQWDFDDGSTSELQNPEHLYAAGGEYNVQLKVVNEEACVDSVTQTVIIAPKPQIELGNDTVVCPGGYYLDAGGNYESYLWNTGATTPGIMIEESGLYKVTVGNGCMASDSVYITLMPELLLMGRITTADEVVNSGVVYLYRYEVSTMSEIIDSVYIDYGGYYEFNGLNPCERFIIMANGDPMFYPNTYSTYYDGVAHWEDAAIIDSTFASIDGVISDIDVQLLEYEEMGQGPGYLQGQVFYTDGGAMKGRLDRGEPVKNTDISLEMLATDEKSTLNDVFHTTRRTKTDETGTYVFEFLPTGVFRIVVEIPGLPLDSMYRLSVTSSDTMFLNLNYYVDTASGIYLTPEPYGVDEFTASLLKLEALPNPSDGRFALHFAEEQNTAVWVDELMIQDLRGRTLLQKRIGKACIQLISEIDLPNAQAGMYVLRLQTAKGQIIYKLIISN